MLITFTQSGSLFNVDFQFDSFNQGDNNTHIVDVAVLDESFSNYEYSAYIQFIREGDKLPSDKFIMANKRIVIDGVAYNGYTFKMASDWFTAVAGVLKATIEIKKFSNGVMKSNKAYGIVNIPVQASVSAISEVESKITDEEYTSLIEQINTKLNAYNYDFKNLGRFASEKEFASACESDYYSSSMQSKNYAYKGYIVDSANNQYTAFGLVGHRNSAGLTFDSMVITQKGITCYQQGNEVATQMPKVEVSDLKVNMTTSVPYPTSNESATNKYYVDSNHYKRSDVDSKITDTKNYAYNLTNEAISVSSSTAKHYYDESVAHTDAKFNEVKSVLDTILKDAPTAYDTLKEIANYIASDMTGASEMLAKINTNTLNIASLNMNKLGKNDKVPYENVVNAPETLDIILRSEVSPDTTDEVKEIEINGMKFKLSGASGSGEGGALLGTPISSDNLPLHTLFFNTSMSNEEVEKLLQLIYDSSTFKQDNMAPIFVGANEVMLLIYSENDPEYPEWAGCALCLRHGMSWRYIYQSIDYAGDGYVGWHPVLKDKNNITMTELSEMIGNPDITDILEFQYIDTSLTDMLTPLVSMNEDFGNGGSSSGGSSKPLYEHIINVGLGGIKGTAIVKFLSTSSTQLVEEGGYVYDVLKNVVNNVCKVKLDGYTEDGIAWFIVTPIPQLNKYTIDCSYWAYGVDMDYENMDIFGDDEIYLENYDIRKI